MNLGFGDLAISRGVDEIALFDPNDFYLLSELVGEQSLRVGPVLEGSVHARASGLDELGPETDGAAVGNDRILTLT